MSIKNFLEIEVKYSSAKSKEEIIQTVQSALISAKNLNFDAALDDSPVISMHNFNYTEYKKYGITEEVTKGKQSWTLMRQTLYLTFLSLEKIPKSPHFNVVVYSII